MASNANGKQVARILYKEIVKGDRRKINAESNDSKTGGGARDFRFGSYKKLVPVIKLMFPAVVKEDRKRNGIVSRIDVFKGTFHWQETLGGTVHTKDSFFEPPTDVRRSEGRIARVHEYSCFATSLIPAGGEGNRVILLLIQNYDGEVWPHFAEEQSLRTPGDWDPIVANELIKCIDAKRAEKRAVIGFRDFTVSMSYCNGK